MHERIPTHLTEREWEVLELLAHGRSNKQIARGLSIGEDTVKHHVSDVYWKLGVGNRAEATAWYFTQGKG